MSGFALPGAVEANTGLRADMESIWDGTKYTDYYVGESGWHDNDVFIDSGLGYGVIGGYNNDILGMSVVDENSVTVNGGTVSGNVYGGYALTYFDHSMPAGQDFIDANARYNTVTVSGSIVSDNVYGGYAAADVPDILGNLDNIHVAADQNNVTLSNNGTVSSNVYGGYAAADMPDILGNLDNIHVAADQNSVTVSNGTVSSNVYGGYVAADAQDIPVGIGNIHISAYKNSVTVNGGTVSGNIYGGYADRSTWVSDNTVTLSGTADMSKASLYGRNSEAHGTDNNLVIDSWSGKVKSLNNFDRIDFKNLTWKDEGTVLEIGDEAGSSLADTDIHLISLAGGQDIHAGEYMYIIKSDGTLNTDSNKITVEENFTAGGAIDGTGEVSMDGQGNIKFEVTGTSVSDQINLVAENRAVAAAFVNQGTDLISDGLDAMNRDGNYGIKTFATVHGNRSQYDVNSDLKINGWSTIVGVGSERKLGSGDFLWGIFYENGSGNYRTYNKFNNEFFRGDGSLLYNGGGIAARFEKDNGIYAEGSLRAGTLKSEMTNALRDGAGNSYGYESESTYYGAHIGAGKIFSVNETTDVDVYGKFFHTYTKGDRFAVAGDVFEFDGVTSNRLRIGSRVTTNKEDRVNLYYGLAYEYEFSGDAHMRAQGMSVPEQSLKGSSYMAEVGMNYKPGKTSPWGFDLNIRGYAGQREGVSCSVLTSYTF